MKNYYEILGVDKTADENEVRKRYRKLAMEYHPDRNPDNHDAEEKFKEISEAYGVLTDPKKRRQYDAHLASGGTQQQYHSGFTYSQEDILRDLFRDPRFQQMFQGIMREFQRSGLRASPHFLKKTFFGGKGGFFISGLFLFGSLAGPALVKGGKKALPSRKSVIKSIGNSIGNLLGMRQSGDKANEEGEENLDITYQTPINEQDLRRGMVLEVVTPGGDGQEILKVTIPEKSRYGQKLRLKGRGKRGRGGRGDLFLHLLPKK